MPLDLVTVPCLSDNYAYLVHDAASGETALVDAPEAAPILAALEARGTLVLPDFIVNAGGIINIADELNGYDWQRAAAAVDQIRGNLRKVFDKAEKRRVTPNVAAIEVAKDRIAEIGSLNVKRRGHRS